jgi:hypothetical protein
MNPPTDPKPARPTELDSVAELDALADQLRAACGKPAELSSSFEPELQHLLQSQPWTLRMAMSNNRMLRVAAALLLVTTLGGPIAALVMMFTPAVQPTTEITMLPPQVLPDFEPDAQPEPEAAIPPIDPSLEEAFGLDWQQAMQRSNRMSVIIGQWQAALAPDTAPKASPSPAYLDWQNASLRELEAEFDRRCLLGLTSPPPPTLVLRIRELLANLERLEAAQAPSWLQAWAWVLDGPGVKARQFF